MYVMPVLSANSHTINHTKQILFCGQFLLYLSLALITCIAAGIQAVTGGLELDHWRDFLGERKCSIEKGVCSCRGQEEIRIKDCKYGPPNREEIHWNLFTCVFLSSSYFSSTSFLLFFLVSAFVVHKRVDKCSLHSSK